MKIAPQKKPVSSNVNSSGEKAKNLQNETDPAPLDSGNASLEKLLDLQMTAGNRGVKSLVVERILDLQKTVGNRTVACILENRPSISQPDQFSRSGINTRVQRALVPSSTGGEEYIVTNLAEEYPTLEAVEKLLQEINDRKLKLTAQSQREVAEHKARLSGKTEEQPLVTVSKKMSSSEVRALVEGQDLDSLAGPEASQPLQVLGQGANKRAYLVKGQNWVILAAPPGVENKIWRGMATEISQLLALKAAEIVTPDFGEPGVQAEPVSGLKPPDLKDPTSQGPAAPYFFKVKAFGGQECRAFIESMVKGIEMPTAIAKKTRSEGANRPEDFAPLVAEWLKSKDNAVEMFEIAIADLKKIHTLFESGKNIPDFQVVFDYTSGHVVTIDPGDPWESGDTLEKHKRWVAGWLKILEIEKANRMRRTRLGQTQVKTTGGAKTKEEVPQRPAWMEKLAQKGPRTVSPPVSQPSGIEPRPVLTPVKKPVSPVKNTPPPSNSVELPKTASGLPIPEGFTEVNPVEGTGFNAVYAGRLYKPDKPIDVPGTSFNYILPNQQHVNPKIVAAKLAAWGEAGPPGTPIVPLMIDRKSGKLMIGGDGHHTFVACLKGGFTVQLDLKKTPFATSATDWSYCTYKEFELNPAGKTGSHYAKTGNPK
jgi:hypothetical protein